MILSDYYYDQDFDKLLPSRFSRFSRFFEVDIHPDDREAAKKHAILCHHLYKSNGRTDEQKIKDIAIGKCAELALYRAFPNLFKSPPSLDGNPNGYDNGYDLIKKNGVMIDVKCSYKGKAYYGIGTEAKFNKMRHAGIIDMDNLIFVFVSYDNFDFDKSVEFSFTGYLSYNEISKFRLGIPKGDKNTIEVSRTNIQHKMDIINSNQHQASPSI